MCLASLGIIPGLVRQNISHLGIEFISGCVENLHLPLISFVSGLVRSILLYGFFDNGGPRAWGNRQFIDL
jgi:hypothetical protein